MNYLEQSCSIPLMKCNPNLLFSVSPIRGCLPGTSASGQTTNRFRESAVAASVPRKGMLERQSWTRYRKESSSSSDPDNAEYEILVTKERGQGFICNHVTLESAWYPIHRAVPK